MVELFATSGDPDHMPHSAASDLGLHCLPVTLLGVSRLQWVNIPIQLPEQTVQTRSKWRVCPICFLDTKAVTM